jgi:hypothetical protein
MNPEEDYLHDQVCDLQSRIAELELALEIAFDYMMDNIDENRERYAGYKPKDFEQWAKDEAQVRAALGMEKT